MATTDKRHPSEGSTTPDSDLQAQVSQLREDLAKLTSSISNKAEQKLDHAQDQAKEQVERIEGQIRENPLAATAIAAGIGFLLGAIISR